MTTKHPLGSRYHDLDVGRWALKSLLAARIGPGVEEVPIRVLCRSQLVPGLYLCTVVSQVGEVTKTRSGVRLSADELERMAEAGAVVVRR